MDNKLFFTEQATTRVARSLCWLNSTLPLFCTRISSPWRKHRQLYPHFPSWYVKCVLVFECSDSKWYILIIDRIVSARRMCRRAKNRCGKCPSRDSPPCCLLMFRIRGKCLLLWVMQTCMQVHLMIWRFSFRSTHYNDCTTETVFCVKVQFRGHEISGRFRGNGWRSGPLLI